MTPSKSRCRSGWPDLPPDLLGVVLQRLPSLVDRVRLRAVCRAWRSSARLQPLPPVQLPWVVFGDGTLLDVANNTAHRVRLPNDAAGCYSAGENMLFVMHDDGRCSLMDAFSGAMSPQPELAALLRDYKVDPHDGMYRTSIEKVVVSMSSALPLIAVLTSDCRVIVSTRRQGGEVNSCLVLSELFIIDIALFQGKIYGLSHYEELLGFELGNGRLLKPTPAGVKPDVTGGVTLIEGSRAQNPVGSHDSYIRYRIQRRFPDSVARLYLVESNDRLLMVKRWVRWEMPDRMATKRRVRSDTDRPDYKRMEWTRRLDVFEADLGDGRPRVGRWKKVDDLGGRAIFVCARCSRSAPAGDGARQDSIYFLRRQYLGRKPGDGSLGDSGVYDMRHKTITSLLPEPSVPAPLPWDSPRFPTWFFPVEN